MKIALKERSVKGKKVAQLRRDGLIPAVCYGRSRENTVCSIDTKEAIKILKSDEIVFDTEGAVSGKQVLIQDVARDPVSGNPIHIDFLLIDSQHAVTVETPVRTEGEPIAVKVHGGQVVVPLDSVSIKALPKNLPNHLTIDISGLDTIGSHLTAGDITLPKDVTLITNEDEILVSIVEQAEESSDEDKAPDMENIEATSEGKKVADEGKVDDSE